MISLVVAMTENRVIGRDGGMPWRLSHDLKRFKKLTMGHHLLMGRKTYESIGRPLPGRTTVVISRTASYDDPSIRCARSLEQAIEFAREDEEIFITGGAQIYELALPLVGRMHVTKIHCQIEGDTYFPAVDWEQWQRVDQEHHTADDKNDYDYSFLTYERSKPNV